MQPKFRKNQQEETRRPHLRPYLGFSRAGGKYRQGWWQKGGQFPSMDGDSNRPNKAPHRRTESEQTQPQESL